MPDPMLAARDLMTAEVVTAPPGTPVLALARLMGERGISAVPILDPATGALVGIVSEADLIRRIAGAEDRPRGWLARLFGDPSAEADRYARTHGATAADVMTTEPATVGPDASAAQVAHLLEERGIRRVPVVDAAGRLLGVVSRADLLRALVAPPTVEPGPFPDERVRTAVLAAMRKQPWADTLYTAVEVRDGIVTLHGFARSEAVARGLRVLAEGVHGVRGVVDRTQPLPEQPYIGA